MAFERMTQNVLNVSALPNAVTGQASSLKATFDAAGVSLKTFINALLDVLEANGAESIGADVSSVTTKTVQAILSAFEAEIANRYTKAEIDTLVAEDTNDLVADLDVNLTTGVITVTKKDGTVETFDTALEKVPATFEIVEADGSYALKITNVDGTTTQADITSFMNLYTFNNSDNITFEVTGTGNEKTVTANIKANSIGLDKLSLSVVSTLEGYMTSARDSASAAKISETNARASELNALEAENTAVNKAAEATASASAAKTSETNAAGSAEDAEYWAKQAQASSQGGDMMKSVYDTNGDGVVDKADNGIIILEASTGNVIDFNTLTEPGVYYIKNCTTTTAPNSYSSSSTAYDIRLIVTRGVSVSTGQLTNIYQYATYNSNVKQNMCRSYTVSSSTWTSWDSKIPASQISQGTFGGQVSANSTATQSLIDSQVRNIKASTTDLTAGSSVLATGSIYLVYE